MPSASTNGLCTLALASALCASACAAGAANPCPAVAAAEQPPHASSADDVAAQLFQLINAADTAGVFSLFGAPMQKAVPRDATERLVLGVVKAKGELTSFTRLPGEYSERAGSYRFDAERGDWRVALNVDRDGRVIGLTFTEPPAADPEVARSRIELQLPFRGQWLVFWGGSTPDVNMHVSHQSQRRAADLVIRGADGRTHRGDGKANSDYFAHGQEVLATAPGEVVTVIDGVSENVPGSMNRYFALGNAVILQHDADLYSMYAHLQPGSARVKVGDKVKAGAVLGACGNSGNSSEPHLHFQLQDGPLVENSWGVEAVFRGVAVERDGKPLDLAEYTFLKGDVVGVAPPIPGSDATQKR